MKTRKDSKIQDDAHSILIKIINKASLSDLLHFSKSMESGDFFTKAQNIHLKFEIAKNLIEKYSKNYEDAESDAINIYSKVLNKFDLRAEDLISINSNNSTKIVFDTLVKGFKLIEKHTGENQKTKPEYPIYSTFTMNREKKKPENETSVKPQNDKSEPKSQDQKPNQNDVKSQAVAKPNFELVQEKTAKHNAQEINNITQSFTNSIITLLKITQISLELKFNELFDILLIYLRNSQKSNFTQPFKQCLTILIDNSLIEGIKFSKDFYRAFFTFLQENITKSDKSVQGVPEFWIFSLRLIVLFSIDKEVQDKELSTQMVECASQIMISSFDNPATMNISFIILQTITMTSLDTRNNLLQILIKESLSRSETGSNNNFELVLIVFIYILTCTKNNEFESIARDITFFNGESTNYLVPLNIGQMLSKFNLKKSVFKPYNNVSWIASETKENLIKLLEISHSKFSKNPQSFLANNNLICLIIYTNNLWNTLNPGKASSSLISDFEELKNNLTKSSKPNEVVKISFDNLPDFINYEKLDNYGKSQYVISLLNKFLLFNNLNQNKVNLFDPNPSEEEIKNQNQLWNNLNTFLGLTNSLLTNYIQTFVRKVLSFTKNFSRFHSESDRNEVGDLLLSFYYLSVYSSFQLSPQMLSIKEDDVVKSIVSFLVNNFMIQEKMEAIIADFYKLLHNKESQALFIKIISFSFSPWTSFQASLNLKPEHNELFSIVKDILLISAVKIEASKMVGTFVRKFKENKSINILDSDLNNIFIQNVEDYVFTKQANTDEVISQFQLFSYEKNVANKKLYLKIFIECRKFYYFFRSLLNYFKLKKSESLSNEQLSKLEKIITKLFNDILKNEFSSPINKVAFLLLLQISKSKYSIDEVLPAQFIEWNIKSLGLEIFANTDISHYLLRFACETKRSLPSISKIRGRKTELKKSVVLPYLLNKLPIGFLEFLSVLQSTNITIKEESQAPKVSAQNNFVPEKPSATDIIADLGKKLSKKLPVKAKKSDTTKKVNFVENIKEEDPQKLNEINTKLFENVSSDIWSFLANKEDREILYKFISKVVLNPNYNPNDLKIEFGALKENESDLKFDDFFYLLNQNEFNFVTEFIRNLNKLRQNKSDAAEMLNHTLDIHSHILKEILNALLKVSPSATVESKYLISLMNYTLDEISRLIRKDGELISNHSSFAPFLLEVLQFVCGLKFSSSENATLLRGVAFRLNSFITSVFQKKDSENVEKTKPVVVKSEESEPTDEEYCSFSHTGQESKKQSFYHCYTCNLSGSKGFCVVCAKKCHKGHDFIWGKICSCFCDCGDSAGPSPCKCLKKEARYMKKVSTKEKRPNDNIDFKAKNPFQAENSGGLYYSGGFSQEPQVFGGARPNYGNFGSNPPPFNYSNISGKLEQVEELLKYGGDDKKIIQKFFEKNSVPIEEDLGPALEDDKMGEAYSSDEEVNDDTLNLALEGSKLRLAGSFLPHSKFSTKLSVQKPLIAHPMKMKSETIEVDDNSFSISLPELDEKKNVVEPVSNKPEEPQLIVNPVLETLINTLKKLIAEKNVSISFLQTSANLFNEYCEKFLAVQLPEDSSISTEDTGTLSEFKPHDFSLKLISNPTQKIETRMWIVHKINETFFDLKSRALSQSNQFALLFMQSNPPFRKSLENDTRNLIAVVETDKILFYEKKEFIAFSKQQIQDTSKKASLQPIFKNFGDEYLMAPTPFDKNKAVSRFNATHSILSIAHNKAAPGNFCAVGLDYMSFVTVDPTGKILSSRGANFISDNDFILKVMWLPGQKNHLLVLSLKGVRVYKVDADIESPVIIFNTLETYLKDATVYQVDNSKEFRVICTSADGQIYTQLFDIEGKTPENCEELFMVETIIIPNEVRPNSNRPSVSVHFSKLSNLLFCSFDDGTLIIGKLSEKDLELINPIKLNPNDNKDASQYPFFNKFGNVFSSFEDAFIDENSYYTVGISRKGNAGLDMTLNNPGLGMGIHVTKDVISYQPIFNIKTPKVDSFTLFEYTIKEKKSYFLLCMMEDGNLQVNQLSFGEPEKTVVQEPEPLLNPVQASTNLLTDIENLIKPHNVEDNEPKCNLVTSELLDIKNSNFYVDYMEKATLLDSNILAYEDEMAKIPLPQPNSSGNKMVMPQQLGLSAGPSAQIALDKNLTFTLKFKSKSHVLYGVRLKMEVITPLKFKVFNREISIINSVSEKSRPIDIFLTEEEIAYASIAGKFRFSILQSPKRINLKIYSAEPMGVAVETYLAQIKSERLKGLKKKLDEFESSQKKDEEEALPVANALKIDNPLSFKTFGDKDEDNMKKMLETLWIAFNTDLFNTSSLDNQTLESLINNLTTAISTIYNPSLRKASKKALKSVLKSYQEKNSIKITNLLGYKYDYYTLKDFSVFKNFNTILEKKEANEEAFSNILRTLNKIQQKRPIQLIKMFSQFPNFIDTLCFLAVQIYKEKKIETKPSDSFDELNYIAELLIVNYNYQKNKAIQKLLPDPKDKVTENILNLEEVKNAGRSCMTMIYDFLFSVAKPYRYSLAKNIVRIFYFEAIIFNKQTQNGTGEKFEYCTDIFSATAETSASPAKIIDEENLTEEELYERAIQMSLNEGEKTEKPVELLSFNFYKFDMSKDFFNHLVSKISQIKDHIEDFGVIFKLISKILKIREMISNALSSSLDNDYFKSIANLLSETLKGTSKDSIQNLKECNLQKLLCIMNMVNNAFHVRDFEKSAKKEKDKDKPIPKPKSTEDKLALVAAKLNKESGDKEAPAQASSKQSMSLSKEYGNKLANAFQEIENDSELIGKWFFEFIEAAFQHFKSGKGTVYATENESVIKRVPNLQKVLKSEVEYLMQSWSAVFKKSEIQKREGNLFVELDQDALYSSIIFLATLTGLGFKFKTINKWPELLSSLIYTPVTASFGTSYIKYLIKEILQSKEESYKVRDTVLYGMETVPLKELFKATGHFFKLLTYDQLVSATRSLTKLNTVSSERPKNWSDYCKNHDKEIIPILHQLLLLNQNEIIEYTFNLLASYYSPREVKPENPQDALSKLNKNHVLSDEIMRTESSWIESTDSYIEQYIDDILLNNFSDKIASSAFKMIVSLWNVANNVQRMFIVNKVLQRLSNVNKYGHNSNYLFGLLGHISRLTKWDSSTKLTELRDQFSEQIIKLLDGLIQKITCHPNYALYSSIQEFLKERTGASTKYYLDGEACFRCYEDSTVPSQEMRVNDIKTEYKFTHNCMLVKLANPYTINSVIVNTDERNQYKKFKMLKGFNVYINNKITAELVDLKNNWSEWKKIVSYTIDRKKDREDRNRFVINLPLPSTAKNLMVEFLLNESSGGLFEAATIICPICTKKFDNRYGNGRCLSCGESILECRKCGYFAEERLDNLLCSQCGSSKFVNYELSISGKLGFMTENLDSEKARETSEKNLQGFLQKLHTSARDLSETKRKIQDLVTLYYESDSVDVLKIAGVQQISIIQEITNAYLREGKDNYEKLMKNVGSIKSLRKTLQEYYNSQNTVVVAERKQSAEEYKPFQESTECYNCLLNALKAYFNFLSTPNQNIGLSQSILKKDPEFIYRLLDLGTTSIGLENTKKITRSVVSFVLIAIENNDSSILEKVLERIHQDITAAVQSNTKSLKEMRNIHYKMMIINDINRSLKGLISIKEKKNEKPELQILLWKRTCEKLIEILNTALKISIENPVLSEYLLASTLTNIKDYIKLVNIKVEPEKAQPKAEKVEEEKFQLEQEEEKAEENDIELKIDIPDGKDDSLMKDSRTANLFGVEMLIKALLPENCITKEILESENPRDILSRKPTSEGLDYLNKSWLTLCLSHSSNRIVMITQQIIREAAYEKVVPIIFEIFHQAIISMSQRNGKQDIFFKAFRDFINNFLKTDTEAGLKFVIRATSTLFNLIEKQLNGLNEIYSSQMKESSTLYMINLNSGFYVYEILDIINGLIKANPNLLASLKNSKRALQFVLRAFLAVRRFTSMKNHYIAECETVLRDLFENLKPETEDDKKAFILECVSSLLTYKNDPISQEFLYEQILNIIAPQKLRKEFLIQPVKQPTQEEFIKGNLGKTAYRSGDIGPTIGDLRAKICKELEISDPGPFELLVAGNLVDLDLNVYLVYEKVWVTFIKQKEEEGQSFGPDIPPMKIVIRISGLDGEATENRVSSLVDDSEDDKTMETRLRLSEVFRGDFTEPRENGKKLNGFSILLKKISDIYTLSISKPLLKKLVKLLTICIKNQVNRKLILKFKAVPRLLEVLLHYFPVYEEKEQDSIVENTLVILESILKELEANPSDAEEFELELERQNSHSTQTNVDNVNLCMKRISEAGGAANSKILSSLTKIISFLTENQEEPSRTLISYFSPYFNFSSIATNPNEIKDEKRSYFLGRFIEMLEMLPGPFNVVRKVIFEEKLSEKIVAFILELVPDKASLNVQLLEQNQKNLSLSVRILLGLVNGHVETQTLLRTSGVLDVVYKLADPKIKIKDVGKYCEEIIEYFLSSDPLLDPENHKYVKDLKQAEVLEKKKKAEQAKAEALKRMGFAIKKPVIIEEEVKKEATDSTAIQPQQPKEEMQMELKAEIKNKYLIEDFKEEKILPCISCQEGYINKPDQIVGVYTYTKKLKIPDENLWLNGKQLQLDQNGFTTVTHFNSIHLHCHNAAAKADKQGKKPKQEWEGAIIRNSHTKCNGWFPVRGPKISDAEYDNGLLKFYQTIDSFTKPSGDYIWFHICDLNNMLNRFAKSENFSKETKGGAAEHNLKLIPFYIQLISNLMRVKPEKLVSYYQRLESFAKANTKEAGLNQNASYEEFLLTLSVALVCIDPNTWNNELKSALFHYMMSVGSNLLRGKTNVEGVSHNIKSKVYLSPEFEPQSGEPIPPLSLDDSKAPVLEKPDEEIDDEQEEKKDEKSEKAQDKEPVDYSKSEKNEKLAKFLDFILPMMIITKLVDLIIQKIHSNAYSKLDDPKAKAFVLSLGEYITADYEKIVEICEDCNKIYKDEILKIKYFEAFLDQIQIKNKIEQDYQTIDLFLSNYL